MPLARSCAMSVAPVDMVGKTVAPGYMRALAFSIARYISESRRDGWPAARRLVVVGTTLTAGSPMIRVISAKSLGMSSSGKARMSNVASASDGMTLEPAFENGRDDGRAEHGIAL